MNGTSAQVMNDQASLEQLSGSGPADTSAPNTPDVGLNLQSRCINASFVAPFPSILTFIVCRAQLGLPTVQTMNENTAESKTQPVPSERVRKPDVDNVPADSGNETVLQNGSIDPSNEVRGGRLILINASLCLCTLLVGLVSYLGAHRTAWRLTCHRISL